MREMIFWQDAQITKPPALHLKCLVVFCDRFGDERPLDELYIFNGAVWYCYDGDYDKPFGTIEAANITQFAVVY